MTTAILTPLYVLDTSILVHAVRRDRVWERIQTRYQLYLLAPRPVICVVTVGEMRSLALQREWGPAKLDQLSFLLNQFRQIDLSPAVVEQYALIDSYYQRRGHSMGKNDVWIAATTVDLGGHLLTCDTDFDALDARFLTRTWIDPS